MKKIFLLILWISTNGKSYGQNAPALYFDDVNNFWKCYEQTFKCNSDSCTQWIINNQYIPNSSKCYKELLAQKRFDSNAVNQFWKYRLFLASIKNWSLQLKNQKDSILFYCNKAAQLYQGAPLNDIYFMISSWKQGGTVTSSGLSIGIQYFCGYDSLNVEEIGKQVARNISPRNKLIPVIIHEQIHKWYKYSNPKYVYEACLKEGNCDFLAYKITGQIVATDDRWQYFEKIKDSVRTVFKKEYAEKRSAADWLSIESKKFSYGAAGYYIGFKICEAFYNRSKNKRKALKQIIEMKNPAWILKKSNLLF